MDWNDEAATWDDHPAVQACSAAAFEALEAELARRGRTLRGLRVLDFGCGTGLLTERMAAAGAMVVGFDIAPAMVAVLTGKQVSGVTAVSGDLGAVEGTFDLVTCSSVCAFVPDYPATVRELVARLRPEGGFVQWDWELDPSDAEPYGLSREGIRAALGGAGLTDVVVRTGFEVPFEDQIMAPVMGVGWVC